MLKKHEKIKNKALLSVCTAERRSSSQNCRAGAGAAGFNSSFGIVSPDPREHGEAWRNINTGAWTMLVRVRLAARSAGHRDEEAKTIIYSQALNTPVENQGPRSVFPAVVYSAVAVPITKNSSIGFACGRAKQPCLQSSRNHSVAVVSIAYLVELSKHDALSLHRFDKI